MEDHDRQQSPAAESASKWKLISFLLAGVLIPIAASLLPWVLDHWTPENKLVYSIVGPIEAKEAKSFELRVENQGREPQSNLEIRIPLQLLPRVDTKVLPSGRVELNEKRATVILDTSSEPTKKETKDDFTVLRYEKLRPSESVYVRLFVIGEGALLSKYELERMRITSDNTLARLDVPDGDLDFLFKVGAFLFVAFAVLVIGYGLYYEKIMPIAKKRAELQKQLDKLAP
ncbi:hypothetical protein L3067_14030 [Xanthomonas sp. PPL568]|uniref:hypothetical protein n=1 Tax=Xanthomonas indica TaxID=2912242 RepID=UPI001F565450|nr:hypothetical protein [Xanthomonas indica]MCI2245723.1 hypothetical protein [Xanthomonas indica]